MLGSLLKYEFRALNKVMFPLQLGVLIAGILGTVCINIFFRGVVSGSLQNYGYEYNTPSATVSLFESFFQGGVLLAGIVLFSLVYLSMFITLALIARHVYRNFYSSEGYLTFTLPVSTDNHLLAKIISGSIWLFINAGLVVGVTVVLIFFGFSSDGLINVDVLKAFSEALGEFLSPLGIILIIEILVIGVLSLLMNVIQVIFAIVIGGSAARTHKVLASIGVYLAASAVISTASSVVGFFIYLGLYSIDATTYMNANSWFTSFQPTIIASAVIYLIVILAMYIISRLMLNKNLNLE